MDTWRGTYMALGAWLGAVVGAGCCTGLGWLAPDPNPAVVAVPVEPLAWTVVDLAEGHARAVAGSVAIDCVRGYPVRLLVWLDHPPERSAALTIDGVRHYGEASRGPDGSVVVVSERGSELVDAVEGARALGFERETLALEPRSGVVAELVELAGCDH